MTSQEARYIVISPVKDEEARIEETLQSMLAQTLRPVLWVIVDDGSSDRTPEIVARYSAEYDFIKVVNRPNSQSRQPGSPVVRAFNAGYDSVRHVEHDFVVKLDCDLSFAPDYFQQLLARFADDCLLGIASGVYFERNRSGAWCEVKMPAYHAAGASKVIRRECFEAIGGFVSSRGWDTVDEIRAMSRGWRTRHYRDLHMRHWRTEGAGIGQWRTSLMHGEVYYLTGGGLLFFLIKVIHRLPRKPYVVSALGLLLGYVRNALSGKQKLVTPDEASLYRRLLNRRLGVDTGSADALSAVRTAD
jgi:poly-beta-1,6-N-acetyl-D-glucosamine synthase